MFSLQWNELKNLTVKENFSISVDKNVYFSKTLRIFSVSLLQLQLLFTVNKPFVAGTKNFIFIDFRPLYRSVFISTFHRSFLIGRTCWQFQAQGNLNIAWSVSLNLCLSWILFHLTITHILSKFFIPLFLDCYYWLKLVFLVFLCFPVVNFVNLGICAVPLFCLD